MLKDFTTSPSPPYKLFTINVEELFKQANALDYNKANGMLSVSAMRGPGFFPGCIGTVKPVNNLDGLTIMVLGQDFDTEANHAKINELAREIETNTTCRNLKQLFIDLELDTGKAFFTNAYMGLRPEERTAKTKNTGQSPAARPGAEGFATACYVPHRRRAPALCLPVTTLSIS